jgi:hypothetical protein
MINDDVGMSWNGEAYFYPYMHDYPRHPYFATPMSHRDRSRSDRYNLRGRDSNQSSLPVSYGHPSNEQYERAHLAATMMMSEDPHATSQEFRMYRDEDYADRSDAVAVVSRGIKRERDPSFDPPKLGETETHDALRQSFSSSSDNQCIDSSDTTAKRARHCFQQDQHLQRVSSYPDGRYSPYAMALADPEYTVAHHWMEQPHSSSDTLGQQPFPSWDTSPIDAARAAHPLGMVLSTRKRTDESHDEPPEEDNEVDEEDDRKPAAAEEAADALEPPAAAAPAEPQVHSPATSSSGTSGGERSNESQISPSVGEVEACNSGRAREALAVWYQRLSNLIDFKAQHGHTHVRQKYKLNPPLGIWVNKQRCTRRNLTPEKVAALESIGFDWGKRKGQYAWDEKFAMLRAYKEKHGDCE